MTTNSIFLEGVTADTLKSIIQEAVRAEFGKQPVPVKEDTYLTRKETAKKFRISLPTLNELTKSGRVRAYKIGGRVLYREQDIEASLMEIQSNKFKRV